MAFTQIQCIKTTTMGHYRAETEHTQSGMKQLQHSEHNMAAMALSHTAPTLSQQPERSSLFQPKIGY